MNAFVNGPELNIFASEGTDRDWFQSIYRFTSTDLKTWKRELAIPQEGGEHLFNCSLCRDDQGFLMAYESNLPVGFCFKFSRSRNLAKWEKVPGLVFAGLDGKEYSACPVIRYFRRITTSSTYTRPSRATTAGCPSWPDRKTWSVGS